MAQQIQAYSPARDALANSTLGQGMGGMLNTTSPHISNSQDGGDYSKVGSPYVGLAQKSRLSTQSDMVHGQERVPQMQAAAANALEAQDAGEATKALNAQELKNGYVTGIMLAGHQIQPGFGNATASLADAETYKRAYTDAAAQKLLAFGANSGIVG